MSWLSVGYKVCAIIELNRLHECSIDKLFWPIQFRFKQGAPVTDALFMARRHVDNAHAKKADKFALLALDLAKAFDSIMRDAMIHALKRFGLPDECLRIIRAMYDSREFYVQNTSNEASTNCNTQVQWGRCHQDISFPARVISDL